MSLLAIWHHLDEMLHEVWIQQLLEIRTKGGDISLEGQVVAKNGNFLCLGSMLKRHGGK